MYHKGIYKYLYSLMIVILNFVYIYAWSICILHGRFATQRHHISNLVYMHMYWSNIVILTATHHGKIISIFINTCRSDSFEKSLVCSRSLYYHFCRSVIRLIFTSGYLTSFLWFPFQQGSVDLNSKQNNTVVIQCYI